ncbi:hypothetical protein HanOQP8_Chr06g0211891 [Helianthus annuus]|nr:hypothetical protein HanOQP8_Chr06g0211891 [Helianthus annuus]
MGLLSNRVERSKIKAGDHIYTYRAVFAYSHHGIIYYYSILLFVLCVCLFLNVKINNQVFPYTISHQYGM